VYFYALITKNVPKNFRHLQFSAENICELFEQNTKMCNISQKFDFQNGKRVAGG
jgi:hypothetical protein